MLKTRVLSNRCPLIPRVDLAEHQIIRRRYRHPDRATDDDNDSPTATLSKHSRTLLEEKLQKCEAARGIEERMNILRGAREDVGNLLLTEKHPTSEVDRASATLSDRVTEVGRAVQSQSASLQPLMSRPLASSQA